MLPPPGFVDPVGINILADGILAVLALPATLVASRGRSKKIVHYVDVRTPKRFSIQIQKSDLQVFHVPNGFKDHFRGVVRSSGKTYDTSYLCLLLERSTCMLE